MKIKKEQGFTLTELMIVIAIMGILAAISMAFFSDHAISAKRTDGRTVLTTTAATLIKCKSIYGAYNNANCSISNGDSIASPDGLYNVAVTSAATTFSLVANPAAGTSQANDTDCTSIRLNHLGQQTGTGANAAECW